MKIPIEPFNPAWKTLFLKEKGKLETILIDFNPIIEHIGSTSVSGLMAKPIVDIAIGIDSITQFDKVVELMQQSGYIHISAYNSLMPNRRFFIGLKEGVANQFKKDYPLVDQIPHEQLHQNKLTNIHVWEVESGEWIRHIAFREYLKAHPLVREAYGKLKLSLSQEDWLDANAYNQGKNNFVKKVEKEALEWWRNLR